jgi:cytochrome b561
MMRRARRRLTIGLHWLVVVLLILMMSDGERFVWLAWGFVLACVAFAASGLVFGLMTRPGPKLTGALRRAHPWLHRAMYWLTAGAALVVAAEMLGYDTPGVTGSLAQMGLFSAAALHAIYHLWRHTALRDNALRIITPRALHRYL